MLKHRLPWDIFPLHICLATDYGCLRSAKLHISLLQLLTFTTLARIASVTHKVLQSVGPMTSSPPRRTKYQTRLHGVTRGIRTAGVVGPPMHPSQLSHLMHASFNLSCTPLGSAAGTGDRACSLCTTNYLLRSSSRKGLSHTQARVTSTVTRFPVTMGAQLWESSK